MTVQKLNVKAILAAIAAQGTLLFAVVEAVPAHYRPYVIAGVSALFLAYGIHVNLPDA